MLKFKVKERLLASGTKNPAMWLMKTCGFSKTKAYNIANDKQKMISTADFIFYTGKIPQGLVCETRTL